MPADKYPTELTDDYWKKVEKAIKVSNTGVGQTLRNLQKVYAVFEAKMNMHEKTGHDGSAAKEAGDSLATAVAAAEKAFTTLYKKLESKGKTLKDNDLIMLKDFRDALKSMSADATQIMKDDQSRFGRNLGRFNDRLDASAKGIRTQLAKLK